MTDKVAIRRLETGVPGLDEVLGGGLPEFSFNLIAGAPGSGKTTLAHQIMFALANPKRRALFFTVLGEPALKMLRYQQQFSFFDGSRINQSIRFVNLVDEALKGDLRRVLARIVEEVAAYSPALVFVDSFRSVMHLTQHTPEPASDLQQFVQELGIQLTSWQATTFLVGEYLVEGDANPVFTVADGLLWLRQATQRNSMVRQIQVVKMRGQATRPGLHTFRITGAGIEIFPPAHIEGESMSEAAPAARPRTADARLPMGVPKLDKMLGGGLPTGYSLLVAGPSGSGKTILATAFLAEGVRRGEAGIIVAFEQTPSRSRTRTIDDLVRAGKIGLINSRSLDLSIDEIVHELTNMIRRMNAKRVVIDSLSGFELAIAPTFREDFRESLFRMVAVLSGMGVTVLLTSELEDRYTDLRFSPNGAAFLTDAIIVQRYIELQGQLKRLLGVVKVRGSTHSSELCEFEITDEGIVIGDSLVEYEGLLGGSPTKVVVDPKRPSHQSGVHAR